MEARVAVIYYSATGNVHGLAHAIAEASTRLTAPPRWGSRCPCGTTLLSGLDMFVVGFTCLPATRVVRSSGDWTAACDGLSSSLTRSTTPARIARRS